MEIKEFEIELKRLLQFWEVRMVDEENGGFYGRINGRDELVPQYEKGVILNARILWTFSAYYRLYGYKEYKSLAQRAFDYLVEHFVDEVNEGVFWMLDYQGNPIETKKQVYAQSFAIYGLSEFYKITNDEKVLKLAIRLFELIENYAFDVDQNGYEEALSQKWEKLDDVRLSDKDMNARKTMNTHLHILEAYTNLYRIHKSSQLEHQLNNLIHVMINFFVSENHHFHLFFDSDWNLLSHEFSYGHDIEGSWLLYEAAEVLGNEELIEQVKDITIRMTDAALEGMDHDGGMMNEGDQNEIIDADKHWWPQAEALVGLINSHRLTNDNTYLKQASSTWKFIQQNIIDHKNGEWHWKVDREGKNDFKEDKAGPWKCPYHNGRAMMEVIQRLNS